MTMGQGLQHRGDSISGDEETQGSGCEAGVLGGLPWLTRDHQEWE